MTRAAILQLLVLGGAGCTAAAPPAPPLPEAASSARPAESVEDAATGGVEPPACEVRPSSGSSSRSPPTAAPEGFRWVRVASAYPTCRHPSDFANLGARQSAACAEIEARWRRIPRSDTRCASDEECVVVFGGNRCPIVALNRAAATESRYAEPPCGNPVQGPCDGSPTRAVCRRRCCVAQRLELE